MSESRGVHHGNALNVPRDREPLKLAPVDRTCNFRRLCDGSLALGLFVVQDDCIIYANSTLAQMLAYGLEHIIGKSPLEFVHFGNQASFAEDLTCSLNGDSPPSPLECRWVRSDGTILDVEILCAPLDYDGRPAMMGTAVDVSARNQAQQVLGERLRFERLLANLSAGFVNASTDRIDSLVNDSLQALVEFLGNDRSTLFKFCDNQRQVLVTHCYTVPGCEPFPLGPFDVDRLPWFVSQFRNRVPVFVRNIPDDLPPEAGKEAEYCRAHGIQSNVSVPLHVGGAGLGGLTFAFLQKRCEWSDEIISRLQLIGEVFANALSRQAREETLKDALNENQALRQRLELENVYLRDQVALKYRHARIIGASDAIVRVLADAEQVAGTDAPVLLLGETGTGKELLAQTIHELSHRKSRPMVVVNCASLPATLIESELFGREAGAYTGAASAQVGRFALADGSTLFLDEVGEIPVEVQAKLLRVLQDGRFERLGSPKSVKVNVRIIAATNRDLERSMREGSFRADLYHRLNVFPIRVPPLRERHDDIPP